MAQTPYTLGHGNTWRSQAMPIDLQDTQPFPLPLYTRPRYTQETVEQRFRRLKALSDATRVRLLFVYLSDEKQRCKAMGTQKVIASAFTQRGGLHS